ncbi:MAG: VanZ family protein [Salinisphaera sp.]|jgi:VanZ family protein|nr:VanZ family protein [Salinisphaera sp.]
MTRSTPRWPYALLALAAIGFILYGSLYPFEFRHAAVRDPLAALWATRAFSLDHMGNLLGNILFYMPLGLFGVPALRTAIRAPAPRLLVIGVIGAVLSISMELSQFWIVGRVSTFNDIYPNIAGALIGGLASIVITPRLERRGVGGLSSEPVAAALLLLFLAWRLFPYVPSLDLHQYWSAVKPILVSPHVTSWAIASYTVRWLVAAELVSQAARRASLALWPVVVVMAGVFLAKIVIVHNSLSASELVGAAMVLGVWSIPGPSTAYGRPRWRTALVALALAVFIVCERLRPFEFATYGHDFGWMPFTSLLHGSMSINSIALLEKSFLYGSLIWLLHRLGWPLISAGVAVALGLFITSLAETHLPGRSAEITDTLIALLMTAAFWLIERTQRPAATRDR